MLILLSGTASSGNQSGRYSSAEEEILPIDYQRFSNTVTEEELKQTVFGRKYLQIDTSLLNPD